MTTEEWFDTFKPGTDVRFRRRNKEYSGVVVAQWKGPNGYKVSVRTTEGSTMDVQPVEDELERL